MSKQDIDIGTAPDDGTGDPIRTAFNKSNENFTEVYDFSRSGTKTVSSGDNLVTFTSAFASANYSIIFNDPDAAGVKTKSKTASGFTIESLGEGDIEWIAILHK